MTKNNYPDIAPAKFKFVENDTTHDTKLDTKPIGYFKDAWIRFKKNKGSVFAAGIILLIVIYAIIAPIISQYTVSYNDAGFGYMFPKSHLSEKLNLDFWDGCTKKEVTSSLFNYYRLIGEETGNLVIKNNEYTTREELNAAKKTITYYQFRYNSYFAKGILLKSVTAEEYKNMQKYQDETGVQLLYPITQRNLRPTAIQDSKDGNFWYQTKTVNSKTEAVLDKNGNATPIYAAYTGTDDYTSKVRYEGEGVYKYDYSLRNETGYEVRINYYEYYVYTHTYVLKDGITEPLFLFGTTAYGQDIFTCLASGARFSFIMAIVVCSVNMFVGTIYGSIEGYYGGTADIIMERFSDIMAAVPTMIVITLLKLHMGGASQVLVLFIAYFMTGWIGSAGTVRMQFYRFKNQEYVLAARTLGSRDLRIMFKHIYPNSLGTIVTSSVLAIPGMIFSESSLSYLGIINLSTGKMTSVGTLLAAGQPYMTSFPYMIFFPALFISLLMLSFNLFGNGLRDAFNPALRGVEE